MVLKLYVRESVRVDFVSAYEHFVKNKSCHKIWSEEKSTHEYLLIFVNYVHFHI